MMQHVEPLGGLRILVVEDEFLVAEVLADILKDAGAEVVGPVGWLEQALVVARDADQHLDGAVLDVNLHGEKSYPIADALTERSIKFVFFTGYGVEAVEAAYRRCPRYQKPFNPDTLVNVLAPVFLS